MKSPRSTFEAQGLGGGKVFGLDNLDRLFVIWAFFFQIVLIVHFALRKRFFESYTTKIGWIVYALAIPAVAISIILLLGRKPWSFWLGGLLFAIYAAYGYWVDYVKGISWRNPLRASIAVPYVFLYLSTVMFYWWPLGLLHRRLWIAFSVLFVVGTVLNITSH
ncbi:MAG: hypothetical protein ACK2VD_19820 [Anaerolineae bacterium]|jgi:hypothetical protein